MDPWRHVDADDALVADLLAGTVEAVVDAGGWLHPSLRFVVRGGHAHAESEAGSGAPLLQVPVEAFVPVARIAWGAGDAALEYEVPDDALTGAQLELLMLQAAFHDACGKLPWLTATHPALAPDLHADVIEAVRAFRPSFRHALPTPAGLLWSTRAFRVALGPTAEPVAVPLLDLLDHRCGGSSPTWTGAGFTVAAGSAGPSWLDYGLERDAIGMAVVYGFADGSSAIAHAPPMSLEVDGMTVTVDGRGRLRDGTLLAPRVRAGADGPVVSHIPFRPGNGAALADAVGSSAVLDAIAEATLVRSSALREAAQRRPSAAAAILADAAARHAAIVAAR